MNNKGLLSDGLARVMHNKRYIFWFWMLNVTLAEFGTAGFRRNAHAILDHTLYAQGLVKGLDAGVLGELLFKPELGSLNSMTKRSRNSGRHPGGVTKKLTASVPVVREPGEAKTSVHMSSIGSI